MAVLNARHWVNQAASQMHVRGKKAPQQVAQVLAGSSILIDCSQRGVGALSWGSKWPAHRMAAAAFGVKGFLWGTSCHGWGAALPPVLRLPPCSARPGPSASSKDGRYTRFHGITGARISLWMKRCPRVTTSNGQKRRLLGLAGCAGWTLWA